MRSEIATLLGDTGIPCAEAEALLTHWARSEAVGGTARIPAILALGRVGSRATVPLLAALSSQGDPEVAAAAREALRSLTFSSEVADWGEWWSGHGDLDRADWAARRIREGLADTREDATVREDVLAAIRFLGPAAGEVLARAAAGPEATADETRAGLLLLIATIDLLGREGPAESLLVFGLGHEEENVVLVALEAAKRCGIRDAIPDCIRLLDSDNEEVRFGAFTALRLLTGRYFPFDYQAPADDPRHSVPRDMYQAWWDSRSRGQE